MDDNGELSNSNKSSQLLYLNEWKSVAAWEINLKTQQKYKMNMICS